MSSDDSPDAWLSSPSAPERTGPGKHDPSVWHYTNSIGLEGIVSSGLLWACSTNGLNDSQEIEYGIGAFRRLWERVKPNLVTEAPRTEFEEWLTDIEIRARAREVLVVCACEDGNSLLHWQAYAKIYDGYSIELSASVEYKVFAPAGLPDLYQPDDIPAIFWRSVTYGERDPEWDWDYWDPSRRMIEDGLNAFGALRQGRVINESMMRDHLDRQYVALVYAHKHEGFANERERRLIVVRPPIEGFVDARQSRYGPATRALLAAVEQSDPERYSVSRIVPLPIVSVQLAPQNAIGDEQRVRSLLDAAGYHQVPISRSTTPIR